MKGRIAVAGVLAALAAAAPARAADTEIRAVDDLTPANNSLWNPTGDISVNAGDTVTWRFDGTTLAHNVTSTSTNWTKDSPNSRVDPTPVTQRFDAEGRYSFICKFHGSTMSGTIVVGAPPPPPLSEQPFANDQATPTVFEVTDLRRPRVTRVRAAGREGAARVRFRLDEPGRVTVRLERASQGITRTVTMRRAGARTVTLRGLAAGSYLVTVRARDLGGNRSHVKHARVTVR